MILDALKVHILMMNYKMVLNCHSTANLIPELFDDIVSKVVKPFQPAPVARAHIIREGSCAGGEVKIITTKPWNNDKTHIYMKQMKYNIRRLEKYSGIKTTEFCPEYEKEPFKAMVNDRNYFGMMITFKYLKTTCDRLRLFVRNAVSWSDDIHGARVACECEPPIKMVRD